MDCKGLHCEGCGDGGGIAVLIALAIVVIAAALAARAVLAAPWYAWAAVDVAVFAAITAGIWFVARRLLHARQPDVQAITRSGTAIRAEIQAPARPSRTELERQLAEAQARAALPPSQHLHFHNDTHIYGHAPAADVAAPNAHVERTTQ